MQSSDKKLFGCIVIFADVIWPVKYGCSIPLKHQIKVINYYLNHLFSTKCSQISAFLFFIWLYFAVWLQIQQIKRQSFYYFLISYIKLLFEWENTSVLMVLSVILLGGVQALFTGCTGSEYQHPPWSHHIVAQFWLFVCVCVIKQDQDSCLVFSSPTLGLFKCGVE